MIYAGVDVGSSYTKVVLLDGEKALRGWSVRPSGVDLFATAELCLDDALKRAGFTHRPEEMRTISTGYGRNNVSYSHGHKTEIGCLAKGCYHFFPQAITVVDIGGQDNKVIRLNEKGRRIDFKMNRKCAAGTGAFLEEMARRLAIPVSEMDGLARQSTEVVELGSYCTVFTATEVLEKIRQGKKVPDIVKGLFLSVIKRIREMDPCDGQVVMTGGVVAYTPYLLTMLEEIIQHPVMVPPQPQLTGAWGAAIFAQEQSPVQHSDGVLGGY